MGLQSIKNKKVKMILANYLKKLPEEASRYSISQLHLFRPVTNIAAFKHMLRNTKFSVYVDHSVSVHVLGPRESAIEPA